MIQLIEAYNDLVQRFEDWMFRYFVPPFLKFILFGLKIALFWAFYMMVKNTINELF
jgi:hypothetical protein